MSQHFHMRWTHGRLAPLRVEILLQAWRSWLRPGQREPRLTVGRISQGGWEGPEGHGESGD